jgi:hypothetical protein
MSPLPHRLQGQGEVPFLRRSDQPYRIPDTGGHPGGDGGPLVQGPHRPNPPPLQQLDDPGRPLPSPHLLVVAEGQEEGPPGGVSLHDEPLHRLQDRHQGRFHVQGPPSPHLAVGHGAGEGWMRPGPQRLLLHWNHVLVGSQEDGGGPRIRPLPGHEEGEVGDRFNPEGLMDPGERPLQVAMEAEKLLGAALLRRLERDGGDPERPGEALHRLPLCEGKGVGQLPEPGLGLDQGHPGHGHGREDPGDRDQDHQNPEDERLDQPTGLTRGAPTPGPRGSRARRGRGARGSPRTAGPGGSRSPT